MSGFYDIKVYNEEGFYVHEKSGVYYGDLEEILPRLITFGDSSIRIVPVQFKHINYDEPKKSFCVNCKSDEIRKELNFCKEVSGLLVYESKQEKVRYKDTYIKSGDLIYFRYENQVLSGRVLYIEEEKLYVKFRDEIICIEKSDIVEL